MTLWLIIGITIILAAIIAWAKYDAEIRAPRQSRDELRRIRRGR